jgi:DNA ligase (NAD+)
MSKIDVLREQLTLFDEAYEQGNPLISDTEYEKRYSELRDMEEKTGDISALSPTQTIAYIKVDGLETVKHTIPVLSLEKANDYETLKKWYSQANDAVLVQPKLDGITIVLRYENGELSDAITRGNGLEGERVLHTISTVENLPKQIPFQGSLEIRGECYIPYDVFEKINNGQYANPRAMVAGMVRRHDASLAQGLTITIFDLIKAEGIEFTDNIGQMEFLKRLGFPVVETVSYYDFDSIIKNCEYQNIIRPGLNFPIDGLVLKFNSLELCERLGVRSKSPKYAIAYKFASLEEFTILREIIWQIGKTGQVTPVAVFDPIVIDGVVITRATLHNLQFIKELNISVGDRIVVARANDVIPRVIQAVPSDDGKSSGFVQPEYCPICGSLLVKVGPQLYCQNKQCSAQRIEQIIHFCSRDAMDIEGMGESNVQILYEQKLITTPADLYNLQNVAEDIKELEGFGNTKVNKLIEAIEKSKNLPLSRLLYALAIPGLGRTNSRAIAVKYRSLERVKNATADELSLLEGIGPITANGIWNCLHDPYFTGLIEKLVEAGLNTEELPSKTGETLKGKTFVLTGTMSRPRSEIETMIRQNGGTVSGSVSKKTSYLVAAPGETGTTKYQKAQQLGVAIISEAQLMELAGK